MKGKMQAKKRSGKVGKIVKTVFSGLLTIVLLIVMFAANTLLKENDRMVNSLLGGYETTIDNSKADTNGLDLQYNKAGYTKETIKTAEQNLNDRIAKEEIVLLKNENKVMPFSANTTFSLFSANTAKLSIGGGLTGGGISLRDVLKNNGLKINETLWDFYNKGAGANYGLASGSVNFGDKEDFRINECPLSKIQQAKDVMDSVKGTVPVYILKRVAGEGRDMPRSMYNHATGTADKQKSYLEPDSTELEILKYLNDHFNNTVVVINSNAAIELNWLSNFPNIHAVLYAPDGLNALGDILTGKANPSGRTVDTFASNALASPAAQNFGDYVYYNENGTPTKYNYVSYAEDIYVGYKYYETRYEDTVLKQGNAGDYNYQKEVSYPFGYGLSYTTFAWKNQKVTWNGTTCKVTVDVTNTGNVAGKDVVQIYMQSPYTDYDKANHVEKASVQLVGYAKTSDLAPGKAETVSVTFDKQQLKAYDDTKAKTYILDAGTYYITAGKDAHDAINNILAAKGKKGSDGMTGAGNPDLVATYIPQNKDVDTISYSKDSLSGAAITNQFDGAKGDITYLSRKDWQGTWPKHDGTPGSVISTWGNEINGTDKNGKPTSYIYEKKISKDKLSKIDATDSLNPTNPSSFHDKIVYGQKNGLSLINMRGLDFNDPLWNKLLDELTPDDYFTMIAQSGYGTANVDSINKPFCIDADTASGLIYGGTGKMFSNPMTLAQTWNKDLASEFGTMIGDEAILGGADGWYAPSMNIHRTPFSGRNGEYYSEDPFVAGTVASHEVYGAAAKGLYTYVKHFAFNDQEDHRGDRDGQFGLCTWLDEQAAREIYLTPFEMCMKVGNVRLNYVTKNAEGKYVNAVKKIPACQAVMTSFNRIGYTWAGASYPLITGILRKEWAFNGFVLTDNANTGTFMNGNQMIKAGADGKLTYAKASARFNFDKSNSETYHYGRTAIHHMLYTVANSKAMNGAMPGSKFINKMPLVDKMIIAFNIVCPLLILLMIVLTVRRFRKKKSENIEIPTEKQLKEKSAG